MLESEWLAGCAQATHPIGQAWPSHRPIGASRHQGLTPLYFFGNKKFGQSTQQVRMLEKGFINKAESENQGTRPPLVPHATRLVTVPVKREPLKSLTLMSISFESGSLIFGYYQSRKNLGVVTAPAEWQLEPFLTAAATIHIPSSMLPVQAYFTGNQTQLAI